MENNFRRVPPPPPPRPNIPKPPVTPQVENVTPAEVNNVNTVPKEVAKKGLSPKLRLSLLILGSVIAFAGMIVCGYFAFV